VNNQPWNNHLANVSTHLTALADAKARVQLDATTQDADTVGSVLAAYRSQTDLTWQQLADWLEIDLPSLADLAGELQPGLGGQEMGIDQMAELYGTDRLLLLKAFEVEA